jgi:hypothetical protein
MEKERFDALTRQVSQSSTSRRRMMRVLTGALLGGTMAGLSARLGLDERTLAKSKSKHKHESHSVLQTAGKRRKKHRRQRPLPQAPQPVPVIEPTPSGCSSECTGSGGRCCTDGSCVAQGQCCPDERRCDDGSCLRNESFACCPEEWGCDDGSCVPAGECCATAVPPTCSRCEEVVCVDGELRCQLRRCSSGTRIEPQVCPCV